MSTVRAVCSLFGEFGASLLIVRLSCCSPGIVVALIFSKSMHVCGEWGFGPNARAMIALLRCHELAWFKISGG